MIERPIHDATPTGGRFIVFEGLDGAGTTTQIQLLAQWLTLVKIKVETTKEPTNGPFGAVIRQVLDKRLIVDSETLALAFATDRSDHVNNSTHGVRTLLSRGRWVLCDRYLFSSLAYQSAAGLEADWILEINRAAITPDLTIFVDTDEDVCMERINRRSTHDELFHNHQVLQKTRALYSTVIDDERLTGKLIVVDGNNRPEQVASDIQTKVSRWLNIDPLSISGDVR